MAGLSRREFEQTYQRQGQPVLIDNEMGDWGALERWSDARGMLERVPPDRQVWCRQVVDPKSGRPEEYVEVAFGDLADEVFSAPRSAHYLTQGLVFPPQGPARTLSRSRYPAIVEELAADCRVPRQIREETIREGVLWMGCGGQVTPLHFDEAENFNCLIRGGKRWILFPARDAKALLRFGRDGRGSMVSSIEQLTDGDTWLGGPLTDAFTCEPRPGQILYVPAGYLHQVYSSDEPSIALNFWFVDFRRPRTFARALRAATARRFGFFHPWKRLIYGGLLLAALTRARLSYALRRGHVTIAAPTIGPTSYGAAPTPGEV